MNNPLVEHLKEGAEAAVDGHWARLRHVATRDFWKRTHLRVRQRPVIRVCLGLLVAFVCGVGLGVGVAAMITPEPAGYSVASGVVPGANKQPSADPVIAVKVRKEGAARKKLPSLVDIDPITEDGFEPMARLSADPDEKTAPVAPAAVPDPASAETNPVPAEATAAARTEPADTTPRTDLKAEVTAEPHVQVPIASVVSGKSPLAPAPSAVRPDAAGPTSTPTSDRPAADAVAAAEPQTVRADAEADAEPASESPKVSFAGAKSVEEAAQGNAVPRAQVALVPSQPRADAQTPPDGVASAAGGNAPINGDVHTHNHAVLSVGIDGDTQRPAADENAGSGDLQDLPLPPHPPAKNLQLAALPMPRADAWIRNAIAVPDKPRDAMIAVIVDDMGIDQKRSRAVIDLPAPLTLSFIPYGYNLRKLVAASRAAGHEIMLHQPMEPLDSEADPGPNALRTTVSLEENRRRLLWSFTRLDGIVGLNNHMGSRFTTWKEGMEMVLEEVQDRGLLFVDSFTNNESVGFRLAIDHKLPSASRDVFIDHDITQEAIGKSLQELEKVARRKGYAVGIAHPHDLTREALEAWMIDAMARGFDFVPISHIVRRRMKSG